MKDRLVLGVETSCDETAAAVVCNGRSALSSIIASQDELHAEYHGVVPEIASRAHCERLPAIVRLAIRDANIGLNDLSAVAVGNRPGLIGALLVGVAGAKALAWRLGVPLVAVDHVQAHLYSSLMAAPGSAVPPDCAWPALGLVVSGGHTTLYRLDSPTTMQRLGGTIDDAVGEAYDKVAAVLGLGFPGGPSVDRLAQQGDASALRFPLSRLDKESLDFSFSGLKTAVRYAVEGVPGPRRKTQHSRPRDADVCASFQQAAIGAILIRLERAFEHHRDCRTLLTGGGVTANSMLRAELEGHARRHGLDLRMPPMDLCQDNAAMIAGLGWHVLEETGWQGGELSVSASPTARV